MNANMRLDCFATISSETEAAVLKKRKPVESTVINSKKETVGKITKRMKKFQENTNNEITILKNHFKNC